MKTIKYLSIAILILAGLGLASDANAYTHKMKRVGKIENDTVLIIPARVLHHLEQSPVEKWMFNAAYLEATEGIGLEDWMLDEEYLDESSYEVEGWMLDDQYLDMEATAGIESWMLNPAYLTR